MRLFVAALLFASVSLVLVGCGESASAAYQRGRADGAREAREPAYQERHEAGYREGFEAARPGTSTALSGFALGLYKALIFAGALKLILSLMLALILLFVHSDGGEEVSGKTFLSLFGSLVALLCVLLFGASSVAVEFLLSPAGSTGFKLATALGAAVAMYLLVEVLFQIARSDSHRPWVEAWSMAVIAALLTLLVPATVFLWGKVPEAANYRGANIFVGILLGGLYWLAHAGLSRRFSS